MVRLRCGPRGPALAASSAPSTTVAPGPTNLDRHAGSISSLYRFIENREYWIYAKAVEYALRGVAGVAGTSSDGDSAMSLNHRVLLVRPRCRRVGLRAQRVPASRTGAGQILVRALSVSIDPAMSGWLLDSPNYAPPVLLGDLMYGGRWRRACRRPLVRTPDDATSTGVGVSVACPCAGGHVCDLPADSSSPGNTPILWPVPGLPRRLSLGGRTVPFGSNCC